ncbi:MAG: hypothetical protein ABSG43_18155 [Solirubrobacteraceae bacterium]|jgi:hypothetical protein
MSAQRPLRVGLMLDSLTVPAWVAHVVQQLTDAEFVAPALVVLNAQTPARERPFSRLRAPRRQRLAFNLYQRIDARLFAAVPDAFAPRQIATALAAVPVLSVCPLRPKPFEHRFSAEAIDRIRAADLDVLLRFGFNIIRGEILKCARYGVWSYHHGDSREYRGAPDFFWEMYERNPVTGTVLQVLTDELDAGGVLYRSFTATDPTSLHRGRNGAYWKSAEFVLRCLTDLHRHGWQQLSRSPHYGENAGYRKRLYRTPTTGQMLVFAARLLAGMAARQARKLAFLKLWHVAYRPSGTGGATLAQPDRQQLTRWRRLHCPRGHYYADPFVVEHQGSCHVFFEDYELATKRGVISSARIDCSGRPETPSVSLQRQCHLSYPFVFRFDGDWYMVPETREQHAIELFKAIDFPRQWKPERVLLRDLDAVDPTILEHHGRFWLFACVALPGAPIEDELSLFYADSLRGEWMAHAMNPVVSDVRRARPAGRVIAHGAELIRPAQDCSQRYGGAVVFNRITRLTPTEYQEEPVGRLEPGARGATLGTHTFNAADGWEVIDCERQSLRALTWLSRSCNLGLRARALRG